MITLRLRHIILFTFIFLLTACQFEDSTDCPKEENVAASYINLTIAVSNGDSHSRTRANEPLAGENGDGREAGFERENAVTGITLILYKDANGINTTSDPSPTLDFVRFFPVTKGTEPVSSPIEAYYTTGDQPIGKPNLDFSGTYHAIVIANQTLPSSIIEGKSKLSDLRDLTTKVVYIGNATLPASSCGNFVMTSEKDNTINFGTATKTEDAAGDKHYNLSGQPLIIERMAARIDFWAKGATYQTKSGGGSGTAYDAPGYVYRPWKTEDTTTPTSDDRFVLTSITPFNLNNGLEYLLKRTNDDTDNYLADESGSNYVIDPTTVSKTGNSTPSTFVNALSSIAELTDFSSNAYCHTIASMQGLASASSTIDGSENIVVCYPMENTLPDASPLYYYATGIVIEGDYYTDDDVSKKEHRVYFGYIRHQGESDKAYEALLPSELSTSTTTTNPMNFGIVRNNIYRISINKVKEKNALELSIKVKKWDKFEHEPIYM